MNEQSKPLVSIVVPIYKVAPLLDRCVSSLVSQTYENIEVFLVDDGSPDGSGAIMRFDDPSHMNEKAITYDVYGDITKTDAL